MSTTLAMSAASDGASSPAATAATMVDAAVTVSAAVSSRGKSEIDRLVLARRQQPVHAHAKRRQIAAFGEIDRLARERLAIGLQQALHEDRRPVARPAPPAGRISAFALVKRHGFSPCLVV